MNTPPPTPTPSLRSRHNAPKNDPDADDGLRSKTPPTHPAKPQISILDCLRILGGLFLLSSIFSYLVTSNSILWNYRPAITRPARIRAWLRGPLRLTLTELALYNGTDAALPIYLALNGSVYDVSASRHTYGPGGSYHFFAGRDATRAFVTGCFETDLVGDLRGVEEMFVPVEEEEEEEEDAGVKKGREWKLRREREGREGKRKVTEAVEGWRRMFDGGKGGKYFWVGEVVGVDWGIGEVRPLCEKARKGRPKRKGVKEGV